jgi:chromosome segregation ATPase
MYANPKNNNVRKIIFLIIANIILIIVVLLLFSILFNWNLSKIFSWIPIVQEPTEEEIIERTTDPMVLEKSDMDKREEYLNSLQQDLSLLQRRLTNWESELQALESELKTQQEEFQKEQEEWEKQRSSLNNEEERYRATANMLNNMDIAGAVEIISSEEIHKYEAVNILHMLNIIAEEEGRFSITPILLREMASPEDTAEGLTPEEIERRKQKAAEIINWFVRYDMSLSPEEIE